MMHKSPNISFRRAAFDDATALASLGATTFTETFGHLYPPDDLRKFLKESHSTEAWRRTLADPERAAFLAVLDDTPIGFIAVGACKLPVDNLELNAGEVQMLYVLATHHNLRLGTGLMNVGLEWLQTQGKTPLYVGVWSENFGAQRFYARYEFNKVGDYGFRVGSTVDHEFILKR